MPVNNLQQLIRDGRLPEAESLCRKMLKSHPDDQGVIFTLASIHFQSKRFDDALELFERMILLDEKDHQAYFNKALTLKAMGNEIEAEKAFKKTLGLNPSFMPAILELAENLKDQGRLDESISTYRQALAQDPKCALAHHSLANLIRHSTYDQDIIAMERLYEEQGLGNQDRILLGFALGKAFEELGRYDQAFTYIRDSNGLKRSGYSFDIGSIEDLFNRIKLVFDGEFLTRHAGAGMKDTTPVFVVGMIRSGTSLIEQILSSHSSVFGAGELQYLDMVCQRVSEESGQPVPECFSRLATEEFSRYSKVYLDNISSHSDKPYIVDKMPFNFRHLGLISLLFPKARIIHIRRNPLDNCWSVYKNIFGGAHFFVDDQTDLGRYYSLYADLMSHWSDLLQDRIIDVEYEMLVSDPEKEVRTLLERCGLPFEDSCLQFHKTTRKVRTLSAAQVRRSIYKDSVRLADHYGRKLDPLRKALGLM